MLRKYWFMIFLAVVLVACVFALLEPSWENAISKLIAAAFAGLFFWSMLGQANRIEAKLDAILERLNKS